MGKYYSASDTLAKTCFGCVYKFADSKKTNRRFYSPEHLIGELYENMSSFSLSDTEKAWFAAPENRQKLLGWAEEQKEKKPMLYSKSTPLENRLQFGYKDNFFDIDFGLHRAISRKVLGPVGDEEHTYLLSQHNPWSIKHVHAELKANYGIDLRTALGILSTSYLERKLADFWLDKFYKKGNGNYPALIPELCGTSKRFRVKKDPATGLYQIERPEFGDVSANVRFDFALVNYPKQKKLIIELDGHEFHKSVEDQTKDAVKKNMIQELGWKPFTFTRQKIEHEWDSVTGFLEEYFMPG